MDSHKRISVLTIDGPSGVGKGITSLLTAQRLGWHLLDSGAVYRVLAHIAQIQHVAPNNESVLAALAESLVIRFLPEPSTGQIRVWGETQELSEQIRNEDCGKLASQIAVLPRVRAALLARQRAFLAPPGLVADGRDMGTVVFPEAVCKVFLTAAAKERARRRYKQLKEKGINVNLAMLAKEIEQRDERDRTRSVAPLQPAAEAIIIDTTNLSIEAVVAQVLAQLPTLVSGR